MDSKELRRKLDKLKGSRDTVESNISRTETELKEAQRNLKYHEQAREIIKKVGLKTQQQLQYHISDIASLALDGIFDDPYELKVSFEERRNKTECDLLFVRDGAELDPISASGGGAVDVASFALRIASWSMEVPHYRNVIVLDEPFRFLSVDLQDKASQMIKQLSEKLKLQFIIITHEDELTNYADKVFKTSIKKGRTIIKEL